MTKLCETVTEKPVQAFLQLDGFHVPEGGMGFMQLDADRDCLMAGERLDHNMTCPRRLPARPCHFTGD